MSKSHNDKHDLNHFLRVESYVKWIENLYKALIKKISGLSLSINTSNDKPFSFDDYPLLKKQVDELFFKFAKSITIQLQENNVKEWKYAEDRMADIVRSVAEKTKLPKAVISEYQRHNLNALNAFQNRKTDGLKLSDRVWKYTNQFRNEIEMGLDLGIGEGKSAAQMASELKSYLQDPDKLFRRVRDKHGTLHLSKNAENYHPGQGVYRSSYKNAARLTRTENNIAYHEAMFEKYNQFDFVIGIEIRLSNNPNHCPFCAEMAGKYPKDFKFWGWHPHCRCTTIPILKSWEQMNKDNERILQGERVLESFDTVQSPPINFSNWLKDNKDKIERAKTKPFFIQNNEKYWKEPVEINTKVDKLLKPRERNFYIALEPFSNIIREEFAKLKNRFEKRKLFNEILNDEVFKILNVDDKTNRKTVIHPKSREPDSKNWKKTQSMAKHLNVADKDVIFLAEYKDKPSADALLMFKGTYTIADFKYFTTTKTNTIALELIRTYGNTPTIVMQFEKADLGIFKSAIEYIKRNESPLGNVIIINKYGKVLEIEYKEFINNKYEKMLKGFF